MESVAEFAPLPFDTTDVTEQLFKLAEGRHLLR